jgi:hypothetical protein
MARGRTRWLLVVLCCAAAGLIAAQSASAASSYGTWPNCINGAYPLETQSWWAPLAGAPMPDMSGHVHLGACFPLKGTLSAPVDIDAVIQLHNNPSRLTGVRWSENSTVKQLVAQDFSCATEQCQLTVPLHLDPADFDRSGWREIRFTADTQTRDGFRMYNTTRWCINVVNTRAAENYCGPGAPGRNGAAGWYNGVDYTNVYLDDASFPYKPVSGTWCFNAKFEDDKGFASIDPAFHAMPPYPGQVIYDGPGADVWRSICLDTTTLTDGIHTLHLRTDDAGTKPKGTASGVYSIKFTVANAALPTDTNPPSVPGSMRSTSQTPDTLAVAWDTATDDSGVVAGYKVYRDGAFVQDVSNAQTFSFSGLKCATTYGFEVRAFDPAGNLGPPAAATDTTAPCLPGDSTPPDAPQNVRSAGATQTTATIEWDPANDDTGVTGYGIYVDDTQIAVLDGTVQRYTASLGCGQTYKVQVQAYDAAGNASALSAPPVPVTTAACPPGDTTAPSSPTGLRSTGADATTASVAWGTATDDTAVTGYLVFLDGRQVGDAGNALSYGVTGIPCATTHQVAVKAYDAAGNISADPPPTVSVTTTACPSTTRTINPDRDSSVSASAPTSTASGTAKTLSLDGSPVRRAYLRFPVPAGTPTAARLRVYAAAKSSSGIMVAKATGPRATTWLESDLNFNNAPAFGPAFATRSTMAAGWNEIAIPVAQLDPGAATTFVITRSATTLCDLQSRENTNKPQLVVTSSSSSAQALLNTRGASAPRNRPGRTGHLRVGDGKLRGLSHVRAG